MSLGYGGAARLVLSDGESAIYAYKCTNLNRRGNDSCEDGEVVAPRVLYDQAVADLRERPLRIDGFIVDERWVRRCLVEAVLSEAESVL